MAGTPIIVNVTGGLQDQCGFKKEDGSLLTEDDYVTEWGSNHDGRYKECGDWVLVFPSIVLYKVQFQHHIFLMIGRLFEDVAVKMEEVYNKRNELKDRGMKGREFVRDEKIGMTAKICVIGLSMIWKLLGRSLNRERNLKFIRYKL